MPKKSKASHNVQRSNVQLLVTPKSAVPSDLTFPDISQKQGLECRVLLEDQIILIDVRFILAIRCSIRIESELTDRIFSLSKNVNTS